MNGIPNAYDDLSQVTQTTDFAYDEVDRRFGVAHLHEDSEGWIDKACEMQRRVWDWVAQDGKNTDGFDCRCLIVMWAFASAYRDYSLTELAGRFGKKKQSPGRWVQDFKKQFPDVANHMQHVRNHE